MAKSKTTPWNKIKAEYLQGAAPRELAAKYGLTSQQIRSKAAKGKWTDKKVTISNNITQNAQDFIQKLTDLALSRLAIILQNDAMRPCDHIAAAKAVLDISGLKSVKQEIKGVKGFNIVVADEKYKEMLEDL